MVSVGWPFVLSILVLEHLSQFQSDYWLQISAAADQTCFLALLSQRESLQLTISQGEEYCVRQL